MYPRSDKYRNAFASPAASVFTRGGSSAKSSSSSNTLYVPSVSALTAANTDAVSLSSISVTDRTATLRRRTFFMSLFPLYYTIAQDVLQIIGQFF